MIPTTEGSTNPITSSLRILIEIPIFLPGDGPVNICDNKLLVFVDEEVGEEDDFAMKVRHVVGCLVLPRLDREFLAALFLATLFKFVLARGGGFGKPSKTPQEHGGCSL